MRGLFEVEREGGDVMCRSSLLPLFTRVHGRSVLRSSPKVCSANAATRQPQEYPELGTLLAALVTAPGVRRSVFYGNKRDTALKRADLVAFMERTVVIPRMAPETNMFRFPSRLTERRRLAAFSGVSEAGVVPDSIGTAPSGAWSVSALP